jgi:hypothetical protein
MLDNKARFMPILKRGDVIGKPYDYDKLGLFLALSNDVCKSYLGDADMSDI